MTLQQIIEHWVRDAERMSGASALGVAVTVELLALPGLGPQVAGLPVVLADDPPEAIEIPGPDRVRIDVEGAPVVVFVPLPPHTLNDPSQLEMYNRLRWYGLSPDDAMAGAG